MNSDKKKQLLKTKKTDIYEPHDFGRFLVRKNRKKKKNDPGFMRRST